MGPDYTLMRHISSNLFIFGWSWNNKKFPERRIQVAPTLAESMSGTFSRNTSDVTDVTSGNSTDQSRTLLHKDFAPGVAGLASRALSRSTHTHVTNGSPSPLTDHSRRLLHEAQHTEISHAGICDTSAIQNVPVEILGEIFRHCVEGSAANGWPFGYISPDRRRAPLLLCQVCAHWRQVAISTPVLWSKFSAQSTRSLPSKFIQLWLDRSQTHPLSFHLAQWEPSQVGLLPHAHSILKLFFPHFSRCCDLFIVLDDTLVRQLLSIPTKDKNSVESFTLDTNICTKEFIDQIPDLIRSFTNIHRLSIRESSAAAVPLLTIPWSQLTHVELHFRLPVKTVAVILARCVQIEEFTVDYLWPEPGLGSSPPILLRHLRSLHIRCCCHPDAALCCTEELLQYLTLPALRQFKFCHGHHPATWGRVIFPEFLVRSSCPLESLTVFDSDLVEDDIIALLSLPYLQSLKEIELLSNHLSDRTLESLTYPSSGTGILPNLETIGVFQCSSSDGKLADMVASRWASNPSPSARNISQLTTLRYYFHHPSVGTWPCHDLDFSRLSTFLADGLEVTL